MHSPVLCHQSVRRSLILTRSLRRQGLTCCITVGCGVAVGCGMVLGCDRVTASQALPYLSAVATNRQVSDPAATVGMRSRSKSSASTVDIAGVTWAPSALALMPPRADESQPLPTSPFEPFPDVPVLQTQGVLEQGDLVAFQDGSLYDEYPIEGFSGERLLIRLESTEFDPYLVLIGPRGNILARHDDIGPDNANASLDIVLPDDGTYLVIANGYSRYSRGHYTLSIHRTERPPHELPAPAEPD